MSRARLSAALLAASLTAGLLALASSPAAASPDKATRAEEALRHAPDEVALDDSDQLVARDVITDADGTTHVRFDRTRGGLPVLGADLVVHQASDGSLRGVSATQRRAVQLNQTPSVTREEAASAAWAAAGNNPTRTDTPVLSVEAREQEQAAPRLVWAVTVFGTQADGAPSELLTLVDARNARVVDSEEQVHTAGDDTSLWVDKVSLETAAAVNGTYSLTDTRGGGTMRTTDLNNGTSGVGTAFTGPDNTWGTTPPGRENAAVDAHYGATMTWDYYKNTFGRSGIANDGKGALSRVHYGNSYDNAFWQDSCFCMTYGDGDGKIDGPLVSLDVAGHEMSHGVTSRTARLKYSGESGGLNEATSDIFGTMVEFYANNAYDSPDYAIGEEFSNNQPFRFMYNPALDGASPNCYSKSVARLNVHYSSGIANHFYYLLAEGSAAKGAGLPGSPTCNGTTVGGLGRDAAAKIWYDALTKYMTSRSGYAAARAATLQAASSSQDPAVVAAWNAVGVK